MHVCSGQTRRFLSLFYYPLLCFLQMGSAIEPELAWQLANPKDSPVFVPDSVGVIGLSTATHSFFP